MIARLKVALLSGDRRRYSAAHERRQRDIERVDETVGRVGQLDVPFQLPAECLDQARAKTLFGRSLDRGATLFFPGELQSRCGGIRSPANFHVAGGH